MASPETMPRYSTILRPSIPSVVTISIAASCLRRGSQPTPLAPARECCKLRCKVLTPRQPSGDAPIEPQPFSAAGAVPVRPRWQGPRGSAAAWCLYDWANRSEEHTSELQSLMRISYAVFCLKKKKNHKQTNIYTTAVASLTPQYKNT